MASCFDAQGLVPPARASATKRVPRRAQLGVRAVRLGQSTSGGEAGEKPPAVRRPVRLDLADSSKSNIPAQIFLMCPCRRCVGERPAFLVPFASVDDSRAEPPTRAQEDEAQQDRAAATLAARAPRLAWLDELYAWLIATDKSFYDEKVATHKQNLFASLAEHKAATLASRGGASAASAALPDPFTVVEIGVGAGPNLARYAAPDVLVLGVDTNAAAQRYAEASATAAGLEVTRGGLGASASAETQREEDDEGGQVEGGKGRFSFVHAAGETLPLADECADAVLCTLVLRSVADVRRTVAEACRVLKPGGKCFFLEHVAAPQGTPVRRWQAFVEPLQRAVADNCHMTRDPRPAIAEAGFSSADVEVVNVEGLALFAPHLIGVATK